MKLLRIILALWWALAALPAHAMSPAAKAAVLYGKNACANITLSLGLAANSGANCLNGTPYGSPTQIPGWTSTRASSGTATTLNGTVVSFGSGVPRITDQGLLIEQAATNLAKWSQTFQAVPWSDFSTGTTTVTPNAVLAPDGTMTGTQLVGNNVSTWWAQTITGGVQSTTVTFSVYLRSTASNTISMKFAFNGGATYTQTANLTTGWQRFVFTQTFGAGDTQSVAIALAIGNGVTVYAWGAQYETGSFPTSYIPTTSAAVTRAADTVSISGFSLAQGTVLGWALGSPTAVTNPRLVGTNLNPTALLYETPSGVAMYNGTTALVKTAAIPVGQQIKAAASWTPSARAVTLNGLAAATDANSHPPVLSVQIGVSASSATRWDSYIQKVVIYPTALDVQQLTSH